MGGAAVAFDLDQAHRHLGLLLERNKLVEIRGLGGDRRGFDGAAVGLGPKGGLFDNAAHAAEAARQLVEQGYAGVYATLQPLKDDLRARSSFGQLRQYRREDATSAADVERMRHLLVDLDPVRPSGVSATDEEHALALARAEQVRDYLLGLDWGHPLLHLDSGNGAHLVYAVRLQRSTDQAAKLLSRALKTLAALFDDERVKVDTTVYNPARISRIAGCPNRKGRDDDERPHRVARILDTKYNGGKLGETPASLLEALGGEEKEVTGDAPATRSTVRFDGALEDLTAAMGAAGLEPEEPKSVAVGHLVACRCWAEEHAAPRPAYALLRSNGTLSAHCLSHKCAASLSGFLKKLELQVDDVFAASPEEAVSRINALGATFVRGGFVLPARGDGELFTYVASRASLQDHLRASAEQVQAWALSEQRREASDFTFADAPYFELVGGRLNLWRGLATTPVDVRAERPRVEAWRESLHDNLCAGDDEAARYLLRLLAWKLRHPLERPGVAVYLVGAQGTGKSVMAVPYVQLFGVHGMHTTLPVGRFNSPTFGRAVIYNDELSRKDFSRREHELRGGITEVTIRYEAKGMAPYTGSNLALHVLATNDEDVTLPWSDRRFFLVRGNTPMGGVSWFRKRGLTTVTRAGENADFLRALHHHLLQVRVPADWEPGDVPTTSDKEEAITRGLDPLQQWLRAVLEAKSFTVGGAHTMCEKLKQKWVGSVELNSEEKHELHRLFIQWVLIKVGDTKRRGSETWTLHGGTLVGFVMSLCRYWGALTPRTSKERKLVLPTSTQARVVFTRVVYRRKPPTDA